MARDRDEIVEHAYERLVRKLSAAVELLEALGETDMGLLHANYANRFHDATLRLRNLVDDLKQDVNEPRGANNGR